MYVCKIIESTHHDDDEYHHGDRDLNDGAAGFILKKHCGPLFNPEEEAVVRYESKLKV